MDRDTFFHSFGIVCLCVIVSILFTSAGCFIYRTNKAIEKIDRIEAIIINEQSEVY